MQGLHLQAVLADVRTHASRHAPHSTLWGPVQVLNILLNMEHAQREARQSSAAQPQRSAGAWVKWQQQLFFKGWGGACWACGPDGATTLQPMPANRIFLLLQLCCRPAAFYCSILLQVLLHEI